MHGHLCIMEFRKRGTSVASATSKFACCRMCARLQDHCDGRVSSNRLLPARKKKEKHKADRNCLSSRPRPKAHTRGHPCRECWRQAGRTRPLARHAPGACHQQGASRHVHIRERLHRLVDQGFGPPHVTTCCRCYALNVSAPASLSRRTTCPCPVSKLVVETL